MPPWVSLNANQIIANQIIECGDRGRLLPANASQRPRNAVTLWSEVVTGTASTGRAPKVARAIGLPVSAAKGGYSLRWAN